MREYYAENRDERYPCDEINIVARDKWCCCNFGSSDCPLTVDEAECTMTVEKLLEDLRYWHVTGGR